MLESCVNRLSDLNSQAILLTGLIFLCLKAKIGYDNAGQFVFPAMTKARRSITYLLLFSFLCVTSYVPFHETGHFSANYLPDFQLHTDFGGSHNKSGDCLLCLQAAGLHNGLQQHIAELSALVFENTFLLLQNARVELFFIPVYQSRAPPVLG